MSHEPGLRFWLRYAEREGALVEYAGDHALAVLPGPLQSAAQLPEDVAVTSDPDVAREDGAVLLIAGHPALERAAAAVLSDGDAGRGFLPWPVSAPPTSSRLQALARDRFHTEHGRIDAVGHTRQAYAPLLRVGAMVSYTASLTQRFQEQEEAWVDARTALTLPEPAIAAVAGARRLPEADTTHTALAADLAQAVPAADAELERRASARGAALLAQARRARTTELARADAYYADVLESIERRRVSAPPERQRLLDEQREATRAEHSRRRREIEDEFRPRHELRPFRLHLLHVPALVLPVEIRRGSRTFPFEFTWLLPVDAFAGVRCAHCGAAEVLVAGRERLGCVACLARPAAPAAAAAPAAGQAIGTKSGAGGRCAPESRPAPPSGAKTPGAAPGRTAPGPREVTRPARRPPAHDRRAGPGIERTGNKLALAFWQAVADGTRWPRKKVAPHSPLAALYRLYGPAGPLCAVGLPASAWPSEFTAATLPPVPGAPQLTTGVLIAGPTRMPYALTWWLEAGKPIVAEISRDLRPGRPALGDALAPRVQLDPVAATLWRVELPWSGLAFAVRALAAWWRIDGRLAPAHEPAAIAGAIAAAVSRASALGRRRTEIAERYGVALAAVERVEREAGTLLKLDRERGW